MKNIINLNGQPYRNITTLRESEDLFDDLTDGDEAASAKESTTRGIRGC